MLVACPNCRTRYRLDDSKVKTEGSVLRCFRCRTVFRIASKAGPVSPAPSTGRADRVITVLVANESADFCATVERLLAAEPFKVISLHDGREALDLIEKRIPDVVLLDVALPNVYGFEICEKIRKNPELFDVKTILIASIYDKTRYKREPTTLYGADDYIEKHHLPDLLAAKIYRLVFGQSAVEPSVDETVSSGDECRSVEVEDTSGPEKTKQDAVREEIRRDEEQKTITADSPSQVEAHVKARRLARIIVSDIALYNQKKVEEGIKNGTFNTLFSEEIHEGKLLFDQRIPEEIREGTSYLDEAFEEFITQKTIELSSRKEQL